MYNMVDILRLGPCLMYVLIYIGFICFFGDEVTSGFNEINNSIYLSSWNECPLKLQKHLPTIMIIAQKPVYIYGYMNTRCTLEVLQKVIFQCVPFQSDKEFLVS